MDTKLMTRKAAQTLTEEIRQGYQDYLSVKEALATAIQQAWEGKAWKALGYDTWDAYCKGEFKVYSLSRKQQGELNRFLQVDLGMSGRAAASATGTSTPTAIKDAEPTVKDFTVAGSKAMGADGRQRPRVRNQRWDT